ncbi:transcription factor bHLH111-like isoform X1 [Neltuma alba]|uniref:transcription factor bHLH111-like isoform X1 n=1 Tax=Neltuma alba TaxID=207710 RepID=UPI0010A549B8|nr:transcription factor bHLH111-like isoform X1 [Prosopis alba]
MGDEESGGNSVATSSATPLINWWDLHANSLSSWNTHHHQPSAKPHSNSSSCCEDQDISVSTSFAVDESPHRRLVDLSAPSPDNNHLWTHVLLGVGSNEELQNSEAGGENLMDAVSCKSMMYEPACNYLKKLDTTWEYNHTNNSDSSSASFDHQKQFNGFNEAVLDQSERLSKLVTTWSIAPPDRQVHNHNHNHNNSTHFDPHQTHNNNDLNSSMDHSGVFSSYGALDMKVKQEHHHHAIGYQNNGFNSQYGMPASLSSSCSRNLTDVISFTGRIGRPIIGIHALKPSFRPPSMNTVSDSKKHTFQTSLPTRTNNGRGQGSSTEVKKKRTDDSSSEAISKKPKQETSTASSAKMQAPKVKLGDRITTLQQIVSPFGKTDTASVLFEAIGYIKFLQEQVQVLLSNSYTKTNSHHKETWGSMERKLEEKGDLKSRGLCLVPISWTPQAYRDSTAPDYWTPAYRGCLFR